MKIKNIIGVVALPALLMASAIAFASAKPAAEAKADATNLGTFVFDEANADSTPTGMYGINWTENEAPAGWDTTAFTPVDENSGTFVNGVRVGTEIKKVGPYSYYIAVPGGDIGTVATVKGTWANANYSFTVESFTRKCVANPGKWEYALEEYDVISLQDANMPDFEDGAINTEDTAGYEYTSDAAGLPKKKGFFALRNATQSYAFQFNFETSDTMTGWAEFRIGASGGWNTGHFLKFQFTNIWNDGVLQVHEFVGNDIYGGHTQEVRTDITNGQRTIEFGVVKVIGYETKHFVYFKNNGTIDFQAYWDLSTGGRSTKVGIYAPDTCISITNSVNANTYKYQLALANSTTATTLVFNTGMDILKPVSNWSDYFIPVGDGFTLNGTPINKWNYFKKTGATTMQIYLPDADITAAKDDVIYIGGMFKAARNVDGVLTLFKLNLYDYYFQFNGTNWREVNPDYEAADFAKDLLKLTLPVCSAADEGNHDALSNIWSELASSSYYGKLLASEVGVLVAAEADKNIVVPDSELGIDSMLPEDAIAAAMYRYDFCTAKYNLNPFIASRVSSLAINNKVSIGTNTNSNNLLIVIAVLSITSLSLAGVLVFKRKHR